MHAYRDGEQTNGRHRLNAGEGLATPWRQDGIFRNAILLPLKSIFCGSGYMTLYVKQNSQNCKS